VIDKPLYGNPLAGGMFNVTPPSVPVSEQIPLGGGLMKDGILQPMRIDDQGQDPESIRRARIEDMKINDPFKLKSDDPLMQGYYDSDFYSNIQTADSIPYTFQGKEMRGSSSGASNLKKYLESIGKGDLIQFPKQNLMSVELQQAENPPPPSGTFNGMPLFPEQGVGQDVTGNNPIETPVPSTPNPIQGVGLDGAPVNSFNRVGQQLMGPNQDDILGTLKNIEQGIASLGQGGMDQSSFGGFNNNFGIGSFFPPYGGMYGK